MKKILMLAITACLITNAFAQTYLINTGWENGNVVPSGAGSETTTSYGQQISSAYARSGSYSCRFEVRDSDTKIGGGVRSEQKTDMVFDQTKGDVAWVGYSIYYPSAMINTPQEEMIGQFMQTDNNGNYSPSVGFKNEGDFSLRAYVRQGSTTAIYNLPAFTFPKGEWVDFVWAVKFSLTGDGYIKCWCNGVQKINYTGKVGYPGGKANFKWGIYPGWKTGPNGQSPRVVFWDDLKVMHNNGSYDLVKPGTVETTGNGLKGDYFNNKTLTAPVVLSRIDPVVNFNWGSTSPGSGISNDNFSVRWTGFVKPQYSGTYTFYVNSNDGNRLWVNGVQLTNRWSDGASENYGTINLSAGVLYAITLEMYEGVSSASSVLSWSHASQAKQVIPQARLYTSISLKSGSELTSLGEELLPDEIKIYPIPVTSGVLTIDFGKHCTNNDKKVTILNMQGCIVKSFTFTGSSVTIPMDKPGLFILKVESGSKTYQKKIVVN